MPENRESSALYPHGATSDLKKRVWEHIEKPVDGFTKRCNATKLVYYEAAAEKLSEWLHLYEAL